MGAVWYRARADLRRHPGAWLVFAVVVALGTGIVLAALAAARRTETAYPELVERSAAADVIVPGDNPFGLGSPVDLADVEDLPQVGGTARADVNLLFAAETEDGRSIGPGEMFPVARADGALGRRVERFKLVEGRRARPGRVDEAVASFLLAQELDLHAGDTLTIRFVLAERFPQVAAELLSGFPDRLASEGTVSTGFAEIAEGPTIRFRIVGVEASPAEFPPLTAELAPPLHLTPAFYREYRDQLVVSPLLYVRLRAGLSDLPAFQAGVERLAAGEPVSFLGTRVDHAAKVQRSVTAEATAARLLAALAALAFAVIVGQMLVRRMSSDVADGHVLRSLGMGAWHLRALTIARAAAVGVLGVAAGVGLAIALSVFSPVGLARTAELDLGLEADWTVLLPGAGVALLLVLATATVGGWRAAVLARRGPERRTTAGARGSLLARVVAGSGIRTASAVGVRFALQPAGGAAAVPVWTTVAGVTLAIALLTGTGVFATSLERLLDTPRLYGWTFDIRSGAPALPDLSDVVRPALAARQDVGDLAVGTVSQADLEGRRVDVIALDQVRGVIGPTLLEGRVPRRTGEVVLGTDSLEEAGADLGDDVTLGVGDRTASLRVVGRAVFPDVGDAGQLGTGAFVTYETLERLVPGSRRNLFYIRFAPDADRDESLEEISTALEPLPTSTARRPPDLGNVARVGGLPSLLAALLAFVAAATLAHTLLASVRARRRDLAVLKSLGFVRRQIASTVIWQSTTLAATAALIAIPTGAAIGRWAWTAYADYLGVVVDPVVPPLALIVAGPATVLAANLIASTPAWVAARTRAAVVLRAE